MRSRLSRTVILLVVTLSLSTIGHEPGYADTQCQVTDPLTGQCTVWVDVPGDPGSPGGSGADGPADTGPGAACYWDPSKQGLSGPPSSEQRKVTPGSLASNVNVAVVAVVVAGAAGGPVRIVTTGGVLSPTSHS